MYLYVVKNKKEKYYKAGGHPKYPNWRIPMCEATLYMSSDTAYKDARWLGEKFPEHDIPDVLELLIDE